ncbi:MAG: hypothetical protein O7H41_06420 [Planctomycetota bacterium]|nr:hypothetical protein [Planctomycetota bacterium]
MLRAGTFMLMVVLLQGFASPSQESEKEEAWKKTQELMERGAWGKAIKALKSYKRKHAETDEEKERLAGLIARAGGEKDLAEIQKKYRKNSKVRPAMKKIKKFIRKFENDDDLRGRAEEFREAVRSTYVAVIIDFEESEDWPKDADVAGLTPETDPGMVRHGEQAGRWKTGIGSKWFQVVPETKDWAPYSYFCFWIYSAEKPGRPGYIWMQARSNPGDYFEYVYPIDFKGWKEVRIEFRGKRGFGTYRKPQWSMIEDFTFSHAGETGIPIDVVIDDVRLEKAVR